MVRPSASLSKPRKLSKKAKAKTRRERVRVIPGPGLPQLFPIFSAGVQSLYAALFEKTGGQFQLVAYTTHSRSAKDQPSFLPTPTRVPAYAIGWRMSVLPRRIFHPLGEDGLLPMLVENLPGDVGRNLLPRYATGKDVVIPASEHNYAWVCVTDYQWAEPALVIALVNANIVLQRAALRAATLGAVI